MKKTTWEGWFIIVKTIVATLFVILFLPRIRGKVNIPVRGSGVLAGNHVADLDPVLVLSSTRRPIHYLAKVELVRGPLGFIFKRMGIIPVDRATKNPAAVSAAIDRLKAEKLIGIFPEGTTRHKTRRQLLPFKYGAVAIARAADTMITPFAITGHYIPFARSITITFGAPFKPDRDLDKANARLRDEIIRLMGNEYEG